MEETLRELAETVLPGCFRLAWKTVPFPPGGAPEDPCAFMEVAGISRGSAPDPVYMDVYPRGLTASLALALWFMEFDEDNWFGFQDVHSVLRGEFLSRSRIRERLELVLLKGTFPPMMLDQPVLVDHREGKIIVLLGQLSD